MTTPNFEKSANSIWHNPYFDYLQDSGFWSRIDASDLPQAQDTFLHEFPEWIASSKLNSFRGLDIDHYPHRVLSLGTTQAFDWWHFMCANRGQRIRVFKGEYPYHRDVAYNWDHTQYIENQNLRKGDAVIISVPFSGHGNKHPYWKWLIEQCYELNIPIYVDCAWFGCCENIEVKLSHEPIRAIAFSTTKSLSSGNWRTGMVFTREEYSSLHLQTEWHHGIHLNTRIGLELIRNFGPDTIPNVYSKHADAVCQHYGLKRSSTVHIANGDDTWNEYNRDGTYNRINIRKHIKHIKKHKKFE